MNLYIALRLSTKQNKLNQQGRMFMSTKWAENAALAVRERRVRAQQDVAALLENRRLLEEQSPELWRQVLTTIRSMVSDFNAELGEEAMIVLSSSSHDLRVRFTAGASSNKDLVVSFEATTSPSALNWRLEGPALSNNGAECSLCVSPQGTVFFQGGLLNSSTTPQQVAEEMMDGLLAE